MPTNKIILEPAEGSSRIDCDECQRAFAITLEPSYIGMSKEELRDQGGFKRAEIKHCPFCGGEKLSV
jgi:hypothetical protein